MFDLAVMHRNTAVIKKSIDSAKGTKIPREVCSLRNNVDF